MASRVLSLLLLAFLGTASASTVNANSKAKVSPVQKVIELLDDMTSKITKDVTAESTAMEEYMVFCKEELREKDYAIKTATREIAELEAKIADSQATMNGADDDTGLNSNAIASQQRQLAEAREERKKGIEDFKVAEAAMVESVDEVDLAIRKMSLPPSTQKNAALMQVDTTDAQAVIKALKNVVPGAFPLSTKKQLHSFLQSKAQEEGKESDKDWLEGKEAGAPVADAFESAKGGALEMLKDMMKKAEDELSSLRAKDVQDGQAFALLEQGILSEIEFTTEKLATATKLKSTSEEANSLAKEDLASTTATKLDDQKYSSTLQRECEAKSGEWETRQISAKGEMGAIAKAKEILQKGVVALVQTGSTVVRKVAGDDQRGLVAIKLRDLGRKFHSFQLVELAAQAGADPFVKIRGLIQEMIAKLVKEGEEEATHEAFCNSEMKKSAEAKDDKTAKVEKHSARIDEAVATTTTLKEEVSVLQTEIAEIDKAQKEATDLRLTEKADNTAAMKDFKQSAEAVSAAIGALQEYYGGASLLQAGANSHRRAGQPSFGGNQAEAGGNIVSILEMAEEDFSKLFSETEAEENSSAKAYETLSQENELSKTTKETAVKGKESEVKSLAVGLENDKEDHAAATEELAAVDAYITKLKPECETKVMSYAERKQARQNEIDGLKQALQILEGEAPAL